MHTLRARSPWGALMPEVRAAPAPAHANTTCCHSNRGKRQMKPLHLALWRNRLSFLHLIPSFGLGNADEPELGVRTEGTRSWERFSLSVCRPPTSLRSGTGSLRLILRISQGSQFWRLQRNADPARLREDAVIGFWSQLA